MNVADDILLVDKPVGWTSFDVVAKIRGKIRAEYITSGIKPTKKQLRVGHAGTLDPFATGLLIILLGEGCKKAGDFLKLDKTYEFTAKLGEISTTGDPEGEVLGYGIWKIENSKQQIANSYDVAVIPGSIGNPVDIPERSESSSSVEESKASAVLNSSDLAGGLDNNETSTLTIPTEKDVKNALKQFEGEISQVPPVFSAIKINGKRAYKLAREGKKVEIPVRQIMINKIELIEYNFPYIKAVCDVSSGTYIRTLVEDIGKVLDTGAYCTDLRRTRIGEYKIEDATTIDKLV